MTGKNSAIPNQAGNGMANNFLIHDADQLEKYFSRGDYRTETEMILTLVMDTPSGGRRSRWLD